MKYHVVLTNDGFVYSDKHGNLLIDTCFQGATEFDASTNIAIITRFEDAKSNILSIDGTYLCDTWFDVIYPFDNTGLAKVQLDDKINFINTKGEITDKWIDLSNCGKKVRTDKIEMFGSREINSGEEFKFTFLNNKSRFYRKPKSNDEIIKEMASNPNNIAENNSTRKTQAQKFAERLEKTQQKKETIENQINIEEENEMKVNKVFKKEELKMEEQVILNKEGRGFMKFIKSIFARKNKDQENVASVVEAEEKKESKVKKFFKKINVFAMLLRAVKDLKDKMFAKMYKIKENKKSKKNQVCNA